MLYNVIERLSEDTGYHLVNERQSLIKLANRAAQDLYNVLDCNKIQREVTLVVARNKVVTLPTFVGEVIGMKIHCLDQVFDKNSINQPRYTSQTWKTNYRNWRDLGEVAVHTLPNVVSPLLITTGLEGNFNIVICGQTDKADKDEEVVNMNSNIAIPTTKSFGLRIDSIACFDVDRTNADIVIKDYTGVELATLYASEKRTRYKLIDVSEIVWPQDTQNDESLIDICYKAKLNTLTKDSDIFPAGDDYDNAWYHWGMFLYYAALDDREKDAQYHRGQAVASLANAKEGSEGEIMKKLTFGRNKYYDHTKPYFAGNYVGYHKW